MTQKKESSRFRVPLAIAATVVLGTGAIAYGWLRLRPSPLGSALEGAEAIPAESVLAVYIQMDDAAWGRLRGFGTPEAQDWVETRIAEFQHQLLEETQLDFNRDLKPWMGNVMLALVPREDDETESLLAIVGIRDKLQAMVFANRVKDAQGQEIQEETYRNTTISTITRTDPGNPQPQSYSVVVLGDYLAIADSLEVVKAAIDTDKDGDSFARQEQLREVLRSQPVETPLIQAYVADIGGLQQLDQNRSPEDDLAEVTPTALVTGIGITDLGIHARTLITSSDNSSDNSSLYSAIQPLSQSRLDRFPENTLAVIEGHQLNRSWSQWTQLAEQTPSGRSLLAEVRQGVSQFGIDLDREIFAPLDGTFALGVIPNQGGGQGLSAAIGVGAMAFVESGDRTTLDSTLGKLGTLVQRGLGLPMRVQSSSIEGHSLTEWKLSFFGVQEETLLGYSWLEPDLLALGVTRPMVERFLTPPNSPLTQNQTFTQLREQFPDSNGGLLFANIEAIRNSVDLVMLQTQEILTPEAVILLETVRGIGIAASPEKDGRSAIDIHIPLIPAE